jgi:PPK2 family polyphosphate:nucleotide phosphotransferase
MPMPFDTDVFRVPAGTSVHLKKWPTRCEPVYTTTKQYQEMLSAHVKALSGQQELLYASDSYAVLLIFQAMDAAGKDGVISHVMSGVNPQGCQVYSYKHPSAAELKHDFLWRTTRDMPERGKIGIFNRSYYEEVLIARVHPEILQAERVPDEKGPWKQRYRSIVDFENHMGRNGTRIIKFFLHLSKEEQRKRFLDRIDEPEKNWKFSIQDIEERKYWKDYMRAYEKCLSATSTKHAPWYIIPADDKLNARLIVSGIVRESIEALRMSYRRISSARRRDLRALRRQLAE